MWAFAPIGLWPRRNGCVAPHRTTAEGSKSSTLRCCPRVLFAGLRLVDFGQKTNVLSLCWNERNTRHSREIKSHFCFAFDFGLAREFFFFFIIPAYIINVHTNIQTRVWVNLDSSINSTRVKLIMLIHRPVFCFYVLCILGAAGRG